MRARPEPEGHTFPALLVSHVVEVARHLDVPPDELLKGSGLTLAALEDPLSRVEVATMCRVLARARLLTDEPGLGYHLGLQQRTSLYGYIGLAAASAPTVRTALELAVRFAPIVTTSVSLELHAAGGETSLRVNEEVDFGDVRDLVLISFLLGLQTITGSLTGRSHGVAVDVAVPEPPDGGGFALFVPTWRFGQPENRVVFDDVIVDAAVVTADPMSLQLARSSCQRELDAMGSDDGLVDRVRRALLSDGGGFRSFEEVAAQLQLSERTLRRWLADRGVSFSELTDRGRQERALALLRSSGLTIEAIAKRLDYATTSTFVRAFRRWTGVTPAAYRRSRASSRPPARR
jgi:AraC-like DNA-binding protein